MTSEQAARIKELEQENRELRRANDLLKRASAFFRGGAELVKPVETLGGQALWMSASGVGWLIQATVGSFGALGRRWENRSGLAA